MPVPRLVGLAGKGVIQLRLQRGIQLVNGLPAGLQLEAGPQGLDAQVILLVDHHAEGFLAVQHEAAARALGGVLAADQMPLHEDLLVKGGEVVHRRREVRVHLRQGFHGRLDRLQQAEPVRLLRPGGERQLAEVAGQPHPAGHDNAVLRAGALAEDRRRNEELVDVHGVRPEPCP